NLCRAAGLSRSLPSGRRSDVARWSLRYPQKGDDENKNRGGDRREQVEVLGPVAEGDQRAVARHALRITVVRNGCTLFEFAPVRRQLCVATLAGADVRPAQCPRVLAASSDNPHELWLFWICWSRSGWINSV